MKELTLENGISLNNSLIFDTLFILFVKLHECSNSALYVTLIIVAIIAIIKTSFTIYDYLFFIIISSIVLTWTKLAKLLLGLYQSSNLKLVNISCKFFMLKKHEYHDSDYIFLLHCLVKIFFSMIWIFIWFFKNAMSSCSSEKCVVSVIWVVYDHARSE